MDAKLLADIANEYATGSSLRVLAIKYKYDKTHLSRVLSKSGVNIRHQIRHTINSNYFSNIDTAEKAYWLGFISADGSIRMTKNKYGGTTYRLWIKLKGSDVEHLQKFLVAIGSSSTVKHIKTQAVAGGPWFDQVYISISSKRIVLDLVRIGIIPNKTFLLKVPHMTASLYRDYWRGFIDGDGCLLLKPYWRIGLVGNSSTIGNFISYLTTNGIKSNRPSKHHSTTGLYYTFITNHSGCVTAARLLYQGATVFLNRKMHIAAKMFD